MYSNTPDDFHFKLASTGRAFPSPTHFLAHLRSEADVVFPAIHGQFGEDGGIQEWLESAGIPFVGTGAAEARQAFDKVGREGVLLGSRMLTSVASVVVGGSMQLPRRSLRWASKLCPASCFW